MTANDPLADGLAVEKASEAMPSGETKFFVSYARKDAQFVLKLANDLRAAGANLWVDQLDIRPGTHWDTAVEEALEACAGMLLILSPDAVASDNVKDEVARALESGKRLVPVVIRDCKIPFRLGRVQYIDFARAGEEAGIAQVRAALLTHQERETTVTPARRQASGSRRTLLWLVPVLLGGLALLAVLIVWPHPVRPTAMVKVAAGEFWMGCNETVEQECTGFERPGESMSVGAFSIDRTEVTVAQYQECVQAKKCSQEGLSMPKWDGRDAAYVG